MSEMKSKATTKIVGSAACPVCQIREGNPNSESRACLGADGRISCVLCGRISTPVPPAAGDIYAQPEIIRNTVAELVSSTSVEAEIFRLAGITSGDGFGAYHLGGSIEDVLTTVSMARGKHAFERVELSFTANDLKFAEQADPGIGKDYDRKSIGCLVPIGIDQAARALVAQGFRFTGANVGASLRTLTLIKGGAIDGAQKADGAPTRSLVGVRASLSWVAD